MIAPLILALPLLAVWTARGPVAAAVGPEPASEGA